GGEAMAAHHRRHARERGPENAGATSALPQPTRHAGRNEFAKDSYAPQAACPFPAIERERVQASAG
ncbi:MAG TPA: hypothetical protein PLB41_15075, partial [Rubrivivax sp.]|nr:hypothetical protein [Rubrivivax sp.]HPO18044.1 hypothetical protein [Rubrivivax sp.]